jgi:hypothetical protein
MTSRPAHCLALQKKRPNEKKNIGIGNMSLKEIKIFYS